MGAEAKPVGSSHPTGSAQVPSTENRVLSLSQIYIDSDPAAWEFPGGGCHRTSQLHEILARAGHQVRVIEKEPPGSNFRKYWLGLHFLLRQGFRQRCSLRLVRRHGAIAARLAVSLPRSGQGKVILWEDTHRNNQALPFVARGLGCAPVAVPQNLESLVPRQMTRPVEIRARRMAEELRYLRAASAVFCISREEQWWLALQGLASDLLPYYPPANLVKFLMQIRAQRETSSKTRWLIFGSANYPPNYLGLARLIEVLKKFPGGSSLPVEIAGFQTERLKACLEGTNFQLHGGVDQSALGQLLSRAKAVLVCQMAGAGVLTRIPEMLIAGVPVIASPIAARSAASLAGVHIYNSEVELHALLQLQAGEVPVPQRPRDAEERFISKLQELAGRLVTSGVSG